MMFHCFLGSGQPECDWWEEKNGAKIWTGSRVFSSWSCIRSDLNYCTFQLFESGEYKSRFQFACNNNKAWKYSLNFIFCHQCSPAQGVFGASHRCTQSEVSIRGCSAAALASCDCNDCMAV